MSSKRFRLILTVSFLFPALVNGQQVEQLQLDASSTSFFSDFSVVFEDTGDGLLQFDEIVSFSGVSGISPSTGQQLIYTSIAYVPDIPGIATASGVLNPNLPCLECWEFAPSNFGEVSDGWFTSRWTYTISQNPGPNNSFSSTVTSAFGPFAGLFNNGDPVNISLLLDQSVGDTDPAPNSGLYPNATMQVAADFPALQLQIQNSGGNVRIFDNTANPDDQVAVFGNNNDNGATLGGELILAVELGFIGTTDMLPDDGLIDGIPSNITRVYLFIATASGWTQLEIAPPDPGPDPDPPNEVTVPGDECTATAGGCNPTGLHGFSLPAGFVVPPGGEITQTVVPVDDTRADANGRCDGQTPLVLFDGDLIIPPHLCGSPDMRVIITDANFFVPEGTIENEVFPEEFVTNPFECNVPVVGDPQNTSLFVWQPTNGADISEGTAIDLTNGCGSSRGRVRGFSFFVVGLHYDFGLDWGADPEAVTQAFIDLTSTKFDNLVQAVVNARPALKRRHFYKLWSTAVLAKVLHRRGKYQAASRIMQVFIRKTERARFKLNEEINHEGNLLSRGDNIKFLLDEFIVPFAPRGRKH